MTAKWEKKGTNDGVLTFSIANEEIQKGLTTAFNKVKGQLNVPGFRKGKVSRTVFNRMYGEEALYEDALNAVLPTAYEAAVLEAGIDPVSQPKIDVKSMNKGEAWTIEAEVTVKPEVKLGEYKNLTVAKQDREVTEEDVENRLKAVQEQQAELVIKEDAAAEGDTVVIDFEGFVNGEAFEGGKGDNYSLELGSHSFIPGFEDQLVGTKAGESLDVKVTFPEEYQAEDLAGKEAVFKVTVHEVKGKELPELDDEFAQDVSEFDTLEEYKADIKATILERKEKEAKTAKEDKVVEKIIENASMEIPDAMVETQVRQMADDFAQRIQSQGLTIEQYFQFTGMNSKQLFDQMRPQAIKRIQSRLVLEGIVKAENITVSDEDVEKEFEKMAETYKMELDKLKELIGEKEKEQIIMDMAVQKAVDLVVEAATEV